MYQLLANGSGLKIFIHHMDRGFWTKRWDHITQKWQSGSLGPELFLSLSQRKVKVGFWPWVVRWSKGSCFISTKVNPWHSQTTNRSITDHFSIKQNHQGPYHYFRKVVKVVGWFGGDIPTSSKWFETKVPRILYGQRVLSQKMGPYNPKMAEWFLGAWIVPIII